MIDRKTELDIKSLKSFLEFWGKFHALYESIISKDLITKDDEKKFLDTKIVIASKYDELKRSLDVNYVPHMWAGSASSRKRI
jgi:hypothetical protein